jgi:hypothetical protein
MSRRPATLHMPGHKDSSDISLGFVRSKSVAVPCYVIEDIDESFVRQLLKR